MKTIIKFLLICCLSLLVNTQTINSNANLNEINYGKLFQQIDDFKVRIKPLNHSTKSLFQVYIQDRNKREEKKHYNVTIDSNHDHFQKTLIKGNMLYEFAIDNTYKIKIIAFDNHDLVLTETDFMINLTSTENTFTVSRVVDGDTIIIDTNERLRIIGIDAPEISSNDCYSLEAKNYLQDLIEGKNIKLELGQNTNNQDIFGRLLRYIYFEDNHADIGAMMISSGHAFSYTKYPHEKISEYNQLEQEAINNQRGLWSSNTCNGNVKNITKSICTEEFAQCSEKTYCSEMSCCEEAYFFLNECEQTRLDADKDGIPCEAICGD